MDLRLDRHGGDPKGPLADVPGVLQTADDTRAAEAIRCAWCDAVVTHRTAATEIGGRHAHHCVNPAGVAFDVRCFAQAEGVRQRAAPTLEATFFAGHGWNFAHCSACGAHLGWTYHQGALVRFHGLIADHLTYPRTSD